MRAKMVHSLRKAAKKTGATISEKKLSKSVFSVLKITFP